MRKLRLPLAALVGLLPATSGRAQGPPPAQEPWKLELGLSYVATGGNSETSSAGADLDYDQRWAQWAIAAEGGMVRATEEGSRTAERYTGRVRAWQAPSLALAGGDAGRAR